MVIHLAAVVGGIGVNRANPGKFSYDNATMRYPITGIWSAFSSGEVPGGSWL